MNSNNRYEEQDDGYVKPKSDSPVDLFIAQSINGMREQTAFHCKTWHLDEVEQWGVDMEDGEITFTIADRIVTAPIQVVGTLYNGEFMWGWDHPSTPEKYRKDAKLTKEWGEKNSLPDYTQQLVSADDEKAWEFAAVTMCLAKANGTYRGRTGENSWIYLCFGTIKMSPGK